MAVLQVKRICGAITVRQVKNALDTMLTGLFDMYAEALERMRTQSDQRCQLGMRILNWISLAKRRLLVDELRQALAVEYEDGLDSPRQLDQDNLPSVNALADVCVGLVTIEHETRVIRLVHLTTQEYFDRYRVALFPNAESEISGVCLTY